MLPKTVRRKHNVWYLTSCSICKKKFYASRKKVKVCSRACYGKYYVGDKSPKWKGGKGNHSGGYLTTRIGEGVYVLTHRLVYEKHLGRKLGDDEHVHHIDGNKSNNDIKNLQLMSKSEHQSFHAKKSYENHVGAMYKINNSK